MKITRRLFLQNTAAASAATAVSTIPAVAEAESTPSARERFAFHLAELKRAAEEMDPSIGMWNVCRADDDELNCPILISAHRSTGRYEGDGIYERSAENALGGRTKYQVRLLDTMIDGHRSFDVRTSMDRMHLSEPRLNTFIGRRVA